MGWTIYDRSVADPQAECERICTWDNETSSGRCIASSIVGSTFYAAHEKTMKATGEKVTLAIVLLIQRNPFGYKDMDETMGPNECAAPRHVLEKLDPLPAPDLDPEPCSTCEGTGKLIGPRWHEHAQGQDCHCCDGTGKQRDRWAYARAWRKRAWARHGGEPQGKQTELFFA